MTYFVYLIECEDKSIYTGITTDLRRRFLEHKNGLGGHYTRAHKVKRIIHFEKFKNRSEASRREAEIKTWPRKKKLSISLRS